MVGFQNTSIFDEAGSQKDGKSDPQESADANPLCPQCGSKKLYRDGLRYLADGSSVQRWLCRKCAYRFSGKPSQKKPKWSINTPNTLTSERRICANRKEAKNLNQATEIKTVAGDLERLPQDAKGLITKFMAYLEREGYSAQTGYPETLRHLAKDGANLLDPENVKLVIAQQKKKNGEPWKDSVKMLATYAYDAFCQMQGIKWNMPAYHQGETTLYIPEEKDLDLLISAASRRFATYLQCLKETFADPGEILRLEWIDLKDNVLSINHPVKGHLTGKYEITPKLIAMLNALPRKEKGIFPMTYACAIDALKKLRKRSALKFQNPNLLSITFKSYRHWGGSMLAHYTNGNLLIIKRMLRHKNIQNTMKYIHTIEFKEEDFEETVATTPEEIRQLGKAGWTKYDEITINGTQMHFYRKPKRFGRLKNYPY
jgi:integrase/ribosomal protein L37AE/L43A